MTCPDTDSMIDYVFFPEKLSKDARAEIRAHIEHCLGCKAVIQRYKREKTQSR